MQKLTISRGSISEVESDPNIAEILAEYGRECSIAGMPAHNAQWDIYRSIEAIGALHVLTVRAGEKLVGAAFVLVNVVPHYGALAATTESIFLLEDYRRGMAGVKLIEAIENLAIEQGAVGMLICAPYGSRLADLLCVLGMRETNRVFFRSLA